MITFLITVIAILLLAVVFLILALVEAGNRNRNFRRAIKAEETSREEERDRAREHRDRLLTQIGELHDRLRPFRAWSSPRLITNEECDPQ